MTALRVFLGVLLVTLVACDGDQPAAPQSPREAAQESQASQPATKPEPLVPREAPAEAQTPPVVEVPPVGPDVQPAAPSVEAAPPVAAPAPTPRAAAPVREEPAAPLDLSLPDELKRLADDAGLPVSEPQQLLPPLFGNQDAAPRSFELGGRLITGEGGQESDSWHSLEGAEFELRFRR